MKIHNVEQGTDEWLKARAGVLTASEFDNIVKHDFTPRESQMTSNYLNVKLAEKWTGRPLPTFSGFGDMEQGSLREEKARPWLAFEIGMDIVEVGFITTDDGRIGCSPDGMVCVPTFEPNQDWPGCEIKCPKIETHVSYLLADKLPPIYAAQVHGSMYVTGAPWWYFCSYRPPMPALVIKVERDEDIQKTLHDSLTGFLERFDMAWARLLTRGEPPARTYAPIPERVYPEPDIWRHSQ